ncbi:MAG: response regulator [Sphingomicrobium sp.]
MRSRSAAGVHAQRKPILIVEDNVYLALDLSDAVADLNGRVVGPARTVAEALELLDSQEIAAAIVDCHLANQDVTLLAGQLASRRVPFVIHTADRLPPLIRALHPDIPVLFKPVKPRTVLACLLVEIRKAVRRRSSGAAP